MLSAGIIGIGAAKIGKTAYKAYKGGKALVNGGKAIGKVAKGITKAAPILAGVTSVIEMGVDAYHGIQKATEWTGSDSIGAKVASGIGAALGGTGDGVTGKQSDARKALNVGTGALKGAGIGAAIGSFIQIGRAHV